MRISIVAGISICGQNFDKNQNFDFLAQIFNLWGKFVLVKFCDQNFDLLSKFGCSNQIFRFLSKFCDQNFDFLQKFRCSNQIFRFLSKFCDQNFDFFAKLRFLNKFFDQILESEFGFFCQNFDFWIKTSEKIGYYQGKSTENYLKLWSGSPAHWLIQAT